VKDAVTAQRRAATPTASSWVSANAGSGKTRVLTDRVARLLLGGTEPQRILCLTYTKAAAAEMQNRLFRTLGAWAMLDDPELRAALRALGEPGEAVPPDQLARARTLFARALETPGGLKIQTIHAFCEALLRRFPLEAGVAPLFQVLDDRQARALRAEVLDTLAARRPETVAALARFLAGDDPDALLQEIAQHRAAFAGRFEAEALERALGVEPGLTVERLEAEVLTPDVEALIAALAPAMLAGGPADSKGGAQLAAVLGAGDPEARLEGLEAVLLTGEGSAEPFSAKTGKVPTKALRARHPELGAALDALMAVVAAARPRRLAIAAFARSAALNRFGRAWLAAWGARKRVGGLLDFDDMIDRAQALLERPGTAAWVLWRLDGGIDHILVDEAQDTSPAQWRVIEAVSAEFFAGRGARDVERTIFVVGDEKQSIYSFQGADPEEFGAKRRHYAAVLDGLGQALQRCDLLYSFRSARPILDLVDAVFDGPAGEGLADGIRHHAIDPEKPGRVELWPFLPKPERPDEAPWDTAVATTLPDDPVERLAARIAATIAGWLAEGRALPGADRAIRAGDVMILVQRRGPIFDAVIRALKRARVPVAGADLLRIGGELAVLDLLAALRVAATPRDELSLAAFLRSPLGGVDERALFELAHGREGRLWDALRREPAERWPEARALLEDLRAQADFLRPFELIERMLIRHGGRRALVARLGPEAEDGIDALLDQALAYEAVEPPSLTGFLAWIDRDEVAVKRRSEEGADQVRVMTVHGAKGLEAPIVFLPDTGVRHDGQNPPQVVRLSDGTPAWRAGGARSAPPAVAAAETARRRLVRLENRRLLYVGLTRAQRWLIVCGAGAPPNGSGESWHGLVGAAMARCGAEAAPGPDGEELRLSLNWREAAAAVGGGAAAAGGLPGWVRAPAGRPAEAGRLVAPSALGGALAAAGEMLGETAGETGGDAEAARRRGTAVHRLLEHLYGRPAAERDGLARRLLPGEDALDAVLAEAVGLLARPEIAWIFGPGSMAEVELAAAVGGGRIGGRLDRLVVEPGRVLAIDFKSNRLVPERAEAVPEGILRQLGAYRAALGQIWRDRPVETAVLWTRSGRLMPVPAALVDAAFARATLDPPKAGS
jgi:ATP-dependent helicase/nuclease subunit A